MEQVLFSEDGAPFDWSDGASHRAIYGPKGALLTTLPRLWTPPFALIPAALVADAERSGKLSLILKRSQILRMRALVGIDGLIVRSSGVGESIWDPGKYESSIVGSVDRDFYSQLQEANSLVTPQPTA